MASRIQNITALYVAAFGKKVSDVTKADLDPWMAFNDNVSLESINATMASQSTLVYPTSTEQFVKSTFLAVFGYTPAVTAATTAGFNYWINEIDTGSVSKTNLMIAFLNGASTGDRATIDAAIAPAVTNYEAGQQIYLTTAQDVLTGTDKNDTFTADIIGNIDSLQSGERLDGGAGTDTLYADLGTYANDVTSVRTTSIENFTVRAQSDNVTTGENNIVNTNTVVTVDAERMDGVNRYENNESRADLIIEDVRIDVAGGQVTKDITIAMVSTDAGDTDFGVYFDQHSLINAPAIAAGAGLQLKVMDITNAEATSEFLKKNPFDKVLFKFDGVDYVIVLDENYIRGTYDLLLAEINTKLGQTAGLETVTAKIDGTFTGTNSVTSTVVTGGQTIVLTTTSDKIFAEGGWAASGVLPSDAEFLALQDLATGSTSSYLITSTIILDDVGSKSNGGDLVIGGMSTGDTSSSKGVEQFDITVEKTSSLGNINSTNNSLQEVYIVNGTVKGDLIVNGNNNAAGATVTTATNELPGDTAQDNAYGFSDVKILNASTMTGKVNITAELTDAVVAKYETLMDTATDAAADNDNFVYTMGTSDDTFAMTISNANLASTGTTNREDFTLTVNGGNGNDSLYTIIGDGTGTNASNWYKNSVDNANLTVDGGAGNDTIQTSGAGNVKINAGLGNDTVYTNNDGLTAVGTNTAGVSVGAITQGAPTVFEQQTFVITGAAGAGGENITFTADAGGVATASVFAAPADATPTIDELGVLLAADIQANNAQISTAAYNAATDTVTVTYVTGAGVTAATITSAGAATFAAVSDNVVTYAAAVGESFTATFSASTAAGSITFDGETVAIASGLTATQVATAFSTGFTNTGVYNTDVDNGNGTVTFTDTANVDIADATAGSFTGDVVLAPTAAAATWAVNATNSVLTDLDSNPIIADAILYKAQLTVTLSGASVTGSTGVASAAAVALSEGFESTVTIGSTNYLAGQTEINQAIKAAINSDATLSKLLVAKDGPANTLVITSLIDGTFAATDLAISIAGPAAGTLTSSELAGINLANKDLLNTSNSADLADAAIVTLIGNSVTAMDAAGAYTTSNLVVAGTASNSVSDNIVTLGAGDDVVVLGTDGTSNDNLVFSGSFGNDTVVNFDDTAAGAALDTLDFTSYLNNVTSVSGSTTSQVKVSDDAIAGAVAGTNGAADEIIVMNDFAQTGAGATLEAWSAMTADNVLNSIKIDTDTTNDFGNLVDASMNVTDVGATYVGTTLKNILMIENDKNDGEYKVFELTATVDAGGTVDDYTAVTLVGTIDFGDTINGATVVVTA